jgi:hypothetical protein
MKLKHFVTFFELSTYSMLHISFNATAASRYGSGSNQIMQLRLLNTDLYQSCFARAIAGGNRIIFEKPEPHEMRLRFRRKSN